MAITSVKSTYSLDVETVRTLEEIARRWGVSKSEALRRAIRAAADQAPGPGQGPLEALDELQASIGLTPVKARAWARRVRAERQASSARGEGRRR